MDLSVLKNRFFELYHNKQIAPQLYFAPGRINLIGEHTDYNGGFVLPCAIQFGTYLLIRKTEDQMIRLASMNFPEKMDIPSTGSLQKQEVRWFNYPLGVMAQLEENGKKMTGMELLFFGDIPNGAGLSSSASIEVVTAYAINDLLNLGFELVDLVKFSQRAEHEFAGVMCGIMDQFAVAMGKEDHAVFLNSKTLQYKQVPVVLEGYDLVIANTNKQRGLADSKYNERVAECQLALAFLSGETGIDSLSEMPFLQFFKMQDQIPDELIRRRARHVISENQRVLSSVAALQKNDITGFGALMNASHESLRDNYEVTGFELDTLVEEAWGIRGVIGARMTGAGFGGCTINLVMKEHSASFIQKAGEGYFQKTGLKADFYIAKISNGARKLSTES